MYSDVSTPIYSPVLVCCLHPFASLFVIHACLDLEPDHSCVRAPMSVEHRILTICTPPIYTRRLY